MKFIFTLSLILLFVSNSNAQRQTNIWYFGRYAGLDFNTPEPKILLDGALDNWEGVASYSDELGNLLFYTDGMSIWNKKHEIMENGDNLLGHNSSTESAIIVPFPKDKTKYYVFVVDEYGGQNGLSYSIVDISANDGLGKVTSDKNIIIETPVCEKVTAIRHKNNSDIWLLTKSAASDEIIEWLITENGLDVNSCKTFHVSAIDHGEIPEKVRNSQGEIVDNQLKKLSTGGYMRVSPNGKKIACANIGYYKFNETDEDMFSLLELFDFDPSTGEVSPDLRIYDYCLNLYGVEFANDASKLYYTTQDVIQNDDGVLLYTANMIYQVDLTLESKEEIAKSAIPIGQYHAKQIYELPGALQLSTNGKIYVAQDGSEYLGVINNPRAKGTDCDFVSEGQYLGGRTSRNGLPNFIPSYFLPLDFKITNICSNSYTHFECTDERANNSFVWQIFTLDGKLLKESTEKEFSMQLTKGNYRASLTIKDKNTLEEYSQYSFFEIFDPPFFSLGEDIEICEGSTAEIKNVEIEDCIFAWDNGFQGETQLVNENKIIGATIKNTYNYCEFHDQLEVKVNLPKTFSLGEKLEFCADKPKQNEFEITDLENFKSFVWTDDLSTSLKREFPTVGTYTLRSQDINDCFFEDNIEIIENPLPKIDFSTDSLFCSNQKNYLDCKVENAEYLWSTGQTTKQIEVETFGEYSVEVTDQNGCKSTASVNLKNKDLPDIHLNADTSFCEGESLVLNVSWNDATSYLWQDFSTTEEYEVTLPGIYKVQVENLCGVTSAQTNVRQRYCGPIVIPNIITPNGDEINDYFKIKGLNSNWNLRIFNRLGKMVFSSNNYQNNWNAKGLSDGVYFYVLEKDGDRYKGNVTVFSNP